MNIYRESEIPPHLRSFFEPAELGLEATPEEYVAKMIDVFREVRRVLRSDGTLFLNLGDSYFSNGGHADTKVTDRREGYNIGNVPEHLRRDYRCRPPPESGLKFKDLVGIPWRVALGLQADGWWLRQEIIWHKSSPMPESVTDRPTRAHEQVFLLTKSPDYFYDAEAIKEPISPKTLTVRTMPRKGKGTESTGEKLNKWMAEHGGRYHSATRNSRSVWTMSSRPYKGAHFATFPEELVERCLLAGTSPRGCCPACGTAWERVVERSREPDPKAGRNAMRGSGAHLAYVNSPANRHGRTFEMVVESRTVGWRPRCTCGREDTEACLVLDPFAGSGTVGAVARRLGCSWLMLDINPAYEALAAERLGIVERERDADRDAAREAAE